MNDEIILPQRTARKRLPFRAAFEWAHGRGLTSSALAAWMVPAALVLYLGMSSGGYDLGARSHAGIAVWLIVGASCLVSARSVSGLSRSALVTFSLLAAFAAWTAASLIWTENEERTAVEVSRILTFLGVFALANGLLGRKHAREMLAGITFALTALVGIALFSRMEPNLFPEQTAGQFIPVPEIERRLAYPLNYSGGVATLVTMTLPLLLAFTHSARTSFFRALSAACLPMALVALWLTGSGLIVAIAWIGVATFLAFSTDRLPKLATLLLGLIGGAGLSYAVVSFSALDRGLPTPEALTQGDQLLGLTIVAMLIVAAAHLGLLSFLARHGRPAWTRPSRRLRRGFLLGVGVAVITLLVLAVAGVFDSDLDRFRSLDNVPADASRISQVTDFGSSGRYQQWQSALDASAAHPVNGIGAGTFEFWWARNGVYGGYVRDAHSLYIETLAELGIIGFVVLIALIVSVLGVGVRRTLQESGEARLMRAGALGGCFAFAAAAGVDWMWEIGVLPIAFLMLAAVVISPWDGAQAPGRSRPERGTRSPLPRLSLVAVGIVAILAIGAPLLTSNRLDASEAHFRDGDFVSAYESAKSAQDVEPFAAGPRLQAALVLEQTGQIDDAVDAAEEAVARAPTDWRPRLILSRLQRLAGEQAAAQASYEEAKSLNPRSSVFAR